MRNLTDHVVEGDSANHQLEIQVQDQPGSGGANHLYAVYGFHTKTNVAADPTMNDETSAKLLFQNGPIGEVGVNGITHEALLAILIDRMRGFQAGPFAGRENAIALTHLEDALMWLQKRTRARIKRGVEGTHQK